MLKVFHSKKDIVFPVIGNHAAVEKIREEFQEKCYPIETDIRLDSLKEKIKAAIKKYTDKIDILINSREGVPNRKGKCGRDMRFIQPSLPWDYKSSSSNSSILLNSSNPRIINVSPGLVLYSRWHRAGLKAGIFHTRIV